MISSVFWFVEWLWQKSQRFAGMHPSYAGVALYYHAVLDGQRQRFARQLDTLLKLAAPIRADTTAPPNHRRRRVAVTFDDGLQCVFRNALPELLSRDIPVVIFVPTASLGKEPSWLENKGRQRQAGKVADANTLKLFNHGAVCFGSHSVTHADFLKLSASEAWRELNASKEALENILQTPITLFSFPHGRYDSTAVELAAQCGNRRICTVEPVPAFASQDEFVTGRVNVDPDDWGLEFRLKLLGAYRWMPRASKIKRALMRFFKKRQCDHGAFFHT